MPYTISYPGTLIMYRTQKQAFEAAQECIHEQLENTGSARSVEIYKISCIMTYDPPPPEPPEPGKHTPIEDTGT